MCGYSGHGTCMSLRSSDGVSVCTGATVAPFLAKSAKPMADARGTFSMQKKFPVVIPTSVCRRGGHRVTSAWRRPTREGARRTGRTPGVRALTSDSARRTRGLQLRGLPVLAFLSCQGGLRPPSHSVFNSPQPHRTKPIATSPVRAGALASTVLEF